jgi:2-aminobenzoylacetyl-CoA thioesterase
VEKMDYIIDVTGGKGGSAYLVLGKDKTALMDCGMAYCAPDLINNIKKVLADGMKLDYIFLSHSHYDHIGAVPYLREVWPGVEVMAAEYAERILTKKSALQAIQELSRKAGQYYGENQLIEYDDDLMKVDRKISEGDMFDLGGVRIRTLETPGHTKCSLSFLVNEKVMFASETSGVISPTGKIYSTFITSYRETIESNKKCQEANPQYIICPHSGWVNKREASDYWQKCMQAAKTSRDFVLKSFSAGADEDEIFEEYKNAFQDKKTLEVQPGYAFEINNRAMIRNLINEN